MKQVFIILALAILFIAGIGILSQKLNNNQLNLNPTQNTNSKEVSVGNTKISVEIASTNETRQKGLGQRANLPQGSGMLFVFDQKDVIRSFWMKDMQFPLDFIWIKDAKIVQIDKNIPVPSPGTDDSNLTIYTSNSPVDYVLEVNAGFCDKNNIKEGDSLDLSNI